MSETKEYRERELCHLKMMVDYQRHLCVLSFAALVLTANLTINLFDAPRLVPLAFGSIVFFFFSVVGSIFSQIQHIDIVRNDKIYERPLPHKFIWPMLFSMLGAVVGMALLSLFVMVNWWAR